MQKIPIFRATLQSEFRESERLYEKARHDEAQALHHAKLTTTIEIANNLLRQSYSIDKIIEATGLTSEEVERLRSTL
jgi:hypothetical protein